MKHFILSAEVTETYAEGVLIEILPGNAMFVHESARVEFATHVNNPAKTSGKATKEKSVDSHGPIWDGDY